MYSKKHLQSELKRRGLPHSYPTIMKYERLGIIPSPQVISFGDRQWRVYSKSEIEHTISIIQNEKNKTKKIS